MKREVRNAAFKKKVALEAVRERKTMSEIASDFGIHPLQVGKWKKQLVDGVEGIFESPLKSKSEALERSQIEISLHEKIGRLTMELDWLKKSLAMSSIDKRSLVDANLSEISIARQCELLGLARSSYYFREASDDALNLRLM